MTKYLHLPSNFTLNIITFTGRVKAQQVILKSIVYIRFSQLEARILADIEWDLIYGIYCKQPRGWIKVDKIYIAAPWFGSQCSSKVVFVNIDRPSCETVIWYLDETCHVIVDCTVQNHNQEPNRLVCFCFLMMSFFFRPCSEKQA